MVVTYHIKLFLPRADRYNDRHSELFGNNQIGKRNSLDIETEFSNF